MDSNEWPDYAQLRYTGPRPDVRIEWLHEGFAAIHLFIQAADTSHRDAITQVVVDAAAAESVEQLRQALRTETGPRESIDVIAGSDNGDPLNVVVQVVVRSRA